MFSLQALAPQNRIAQNQHVNRLRRLTQLLTESTSRLPRDSTVVAILAEVTTTTALALGTLKRSGYAVTAIVNVFDDYQFSQAAGRLLAEGIESRHLKDEQSIVTICQRQMLHQ